MGKVGEDKFKREMEEEGRGGERGGGRMSKREGGRWMRKGGN